eukprot:m.132988 g.132988  ORF g.132988 m.132988 type:complete len:399 (+) comp14818_c8_seq1:678-1874(+)
MLLRPPPAPAAAAGAPSPVAAPGAGAGGALGGAVYCSESRRKAKAAAKLGGGPLAMAKNMRGKLAGASETTDQKTNNREVGRKPKTKMAHQDAVTNKSAAQRLVEKALKEFGGEIMNRKQERAGDGSQKRKAESEDVEEEAPREGAQDGGDEAGGQADTARDLVGDEAKKMSMMQRPSGKTLEFELKDVNPFITCSLCKGYLINATTITECLHTFCRSCIVIHFSNSRNCPVCNLLVHETNPLECLRPDRTMQAIVFKILPDLQKAEEERVRQFNEKMGIAQPQAPASPAPASPPRKRAVPDDEEQLSFLLERAEGCEELQDLEKPFVRTTIRATVLHIKKFIAQKLKLMRHDMVDVLCRGEVLGPEHSLQYINLSRWRAQGSHMVLQYRPNRADFQL